MLFHYGNCKDEIDKLNKEIDRYRARKREAEDNAEIYKGETDKMKKAFHDSLDKIRVLESNHDKVSIFKSQEYHDHINKVLDEKQAVIVKLAQLEDAYTQVGIQLGNVRQELDTYKTTNDVENSRCKRCETIEALKTVTIELNPSKRKKAKDD